MVSQCSQLEVSRFTHYDAMNVGAKNAENGAVRGTQGHGQCHLPIERIRLPIQL